MSVWWTDHSDRQVNVLLDPRSPFSCTEAALQAPQAFPDPRQKRPWAACAPVSRVAGSQSRPGRLARM
nr:DUF4913 domain-containing protein [Arthrobacter sp. U41]